MPWARSVQDLASLDETVRLAVNACALATLGRASLDTGLLQQGTRLYARALSETNRALQDPVKAQGDAVLACCQILSM